MEAIQTIFLAIFVAFMGFSPPGMINMTTLKISLEQNRTTSLLFVSGASLIIFIQAFIAVSFASFLGKNPKIIEYLTLSSIGVFLLLALHFYRQTRHQVTMRDKSNKAKNSFLAGLAMASMNMLGIPFFLGYSTLLKAKGWLSLEFPQNWWFAFGAMTGAWLLFSLYALFASFIHNRVQFIARNINYILSLLFFTLAVVTLLNVFI